MNNWNRLLVTMDKTIGFPNKIRSSVKKRWQGFDQWKNEHVIWLEYRVKVHPGTSPPPQPAKYLHDLHQTPVQAKAGAMPANHGFGSDNHENLLPSGPELARERPEEFVKRAELGPGMPALQHSELLSKRQIFKQKALT